MALDQEITGHLNDITAGMDTLRGLGQQIIDQVNELGGLIVIDALIIRGWAEDVRDSLTSFLDRAAVEIQHGTPVVSMVTTAFRWVQEVKEPVATTRNTVGNLDLDLFNWSGPARGAYDHVRTLQSNAYDASSTNADSIGAWLIRVAQANVTFLSTLAKAVTGLIGGFTSAVLKGITAVNVIGLLQELSGLVGSAVETGLNAAIDTALRAFSEIADEFEAERILANTGALPDGHWPEAVVG